MKNEKFGLFLKDGGAKKREVVEQEKRMLSKTFSLELIWHQRLEVVVHLQPKSQDFLAVGHPTIKIISSKWEMVGVYILKNVASVHHSSICKAHT